MGEAAPRAALALAALLAALWAPARALEVHVARAAVLAVEGESAVLPVWYSGRSRRPPYVTWLLHPPHADPFQILTYLDGAVKVEETPLKGRASFLHPVEPSRNLSVLINDTREADSGQYVCTVNVADEAAGRNVAVVNLTVLVPPGAPACRLHSSPGVGRDVTLSCASRHGKPLPAYRWQRAAPTARLFFPPAHDGVRGTLRLSNLSADMAGVYVCVAENRAGAASCNLTLALPHGGSGAVIAGGVLGSVAGCGLLLFLGMQLRSLRRRRRHEEAPNEIKEDAVAPKPFAWPKSAGSDVASRTSTLSSAPGRPRPAGAAAGPPVSPVSPVSPMSRRQPLPAGNLARMGAVPVMVPARSQAGSLV